MKRLIISTAISTGLAAPTCNDGWKLENGNCYHFGTDKVTKPDAKRACFDMNAGLLLIANAAENANIVSELAGSDDTYWLRLNDAREEGQWVVDRWGYEKPTTWTSAPFENWSTEASNDEMKNSAVITSDGTWDLVDKYATSNYICQVAPHEGSAQEKTLNGPVHHDSVCDDGWEVIHEKCYFFSEDILTKPDAKAVCYNMHAGLLLIEDAVENELLASHLSTGDSLWLRINDSKDEDKWVVDRWGYEKPTFWTPVSYFNGADGMMNDDTKNSAVLNSDGTWSLGDKYLTSKYACQKYAEKQQKQKLLNNGSQKFLNEPAPRCKIDWEYENGKCYYFGSEILTKQDAKKTCYDMDAGILLISDDEENSYIASKLNGDEDSFWLSINDSKNETNWVVDRWGYEKPTSWTAASYFNWNANVENNLLSNSAIIGGAGVSSGEWNVVDKYANSRYVCEMAVRSQPPRTMNKGPVQRNVVCEAEWEDVNGKCYFFGDENLTKPDAKAICYNMNAGLLLISDHSENELLASKLSSGDSFWLRINDSKDENKWVVDRWGYEKPTSWTSVSYFNEAVEMFNDETKNSAVLNSDGTWTLGDKYRTSKYACQKDEESKKQKTLQNGPCQLDWKFGHGNCYYFGDEKVIKPDAKRACFDMGAGLVLISSANENSFLTSQLTTEDDSFWLGLNDAKEESQWVVDRFGYEKPASWTVATYMNFHPDGVNDISKNSAILKHDGWIFADKYATSRYVCQMAAKQRTQDSEGHKNVNAKPDSDSNETYDEAEKSIMILIGTMHLILDDMSSILEEKVITNLKQRYLEKSAIQIKYYRRMNDKCAYPMNAGRATKDATKFQQLSSSYAFTTMADLCERIADVTKGIERWGQNYNKSCTNPNKKPAGNRPEKKYSMPFLRMGKKLVDVCTA